MKTVQFLSTLTILVLVSSCGTGTSSPSSDVPCLEPTAWTENSPDLFMRFEGENPDKSLFLHQSFEQQDIDILDGRFDLIPHDPIYRFDQIANRFEIVDDSVWENDNSEIENCLRYSTRDSSFTAVIGSSLLYNEQQVTVEGGTFLRMFPATFSDSLETKAVAVLSTDGSPGIPFFLFSIASTGQHFHQLFSEVDGQPLGPPLRVGIGGLDQGGLQVCWALDNKFVIYAETASGSGGYSKICVVDVEDEIQSVSGN